MMSNFIPGCGIKTDRSLESVMQRMAAVLRAETVKLTLTADEIEQRFGCKEVMRQPESAFAIDVAKQLRDALKEFPEGWCDPATRVIAVKLLDSVF